MKVLITGAAGFLGWHLRVRLAALTDHEVLSVDIGNWSELNSLVAQADAVIHLAGVNRGTDDEVSDGNLQLASDIVAALSEAKRPIRVVYSNSIHADGNTLYGNAKRGAHEILASYGEKTGVHVVNVLLPNLFGEHGRAAYNSFVATFAHAVANDQPPVSVNDNQVPLLHAQCAAQTLIEALECRETELRPQGRNSGVVEVLNKLKAFRELYRVGTFPNLDDPFDEALFNTLRAAMFPEQYPIAMTAHADERGHFVELVKCLGGQGQTSISTTRPGITRGNHYHLHKAERFAVVSGEARISLRRIGTEEVVHFDVSGDKPVVVDMPTMWSHSITNTGQNELITLFWIDRLFDPADPDTYFEPVLKESSHA